MAIKLGYYEKDTDTEDKRIVVRGQFSINPADPQDNWFFGSINALTIQRVCQAFRMEDECTQISQKVQESGFPYGVEVSFAGKRK